MKGDEFYKKSTFEFSDKALYKIANLMKHGYEMKEGVTGSRVTKSNDDLIILKSGEVFKKVIY